MILDPYNIPVVLRRERVLRMVVWRGHAMWVSFNEGAVFPDLRDWFVPREDLLREQLSNDHPWMIDEDPDDTGRVRT